MKELFRDVAGYEGLYQVSNLGNVRSLGMWRGNRNDGYFQKGRILKPGKRKDGYLNVVLCKEGKRKTYMVHRLVAQAFIENPDNLPEVNHIDEDKENNSVGNLEWCNNVYNNNHGTRNQRISEALRGVKRPDIVEALSKKVLQLTLDGVLVKEWESTAECGRNGFDRSAVSKCCRGERKTHKGFRWCYAD